MSRTGATGAANKPLDPTAETAAGQRQRYYSCHAVNTTGGKARAYEDDQLSAIYDRTSGYCHICGRKVAFQNYGMRGARGAWEVEHSNPRFRGGTTRLNNLYAACISCNRSKGATATRTARARNGRTRAPLSVERRREARREGAIDGGIIGGAVGSVFGPAGTILGALIGGRAGYKRNPDG